MLSDATLAQNKLEVTFKNAFRSKFIEAHKASSLLILLTALLFDSKEHILI